jgi:hypothetical protein
MRGLVDYLALLFTLFCAIIAEPQMGVIAPSRMAFVPSPAEPRQPIRSLQLPIGARYYRSVSFPVLGRQAFQIHVLSDATARLQITGMLAIDEIIPYSTDLAGRLSFTLSEKTKEILRKFKTKLLEAGYDPRTDEPYFKVAPYVLPALKIRMGRLNKEPSLQ